VRLAFNGHHPAVGKIHSAGVVGEGGNHEGMIDFAGGGHQLFQQAQAFPGGVVAVIAPALHQNLNLRIRVRPAALCSCA
jgi:hypothetical protein